MSEETVWEQWRNAILDDIERAKQNPENIRYYEGKYKVVVMPESKDVFFKGYRLVAALERFPNNSIKMMVEVNSQFCTSTAHLFLKPCFANQKLRDGSGAESAKKPSRSEAEQ